MGRCPVRASDERTLYERAQATLEFALLRSRLRRFVFPMSAAFMLWYLTYILLASYAPEFMGRSVLGNINVALVMGLLQFATTFAIATVYMWYADMRLDPLAKRIRTRVDGC
jgi:uncharacterized membrane protein (DUF485 family)